MPKEPSAHMRVRGWAWSCRERQCLQTSTMHPCPHLPTCSTQGDPHSTSHTQGAGGFLFLQLAIKLPECCCLLQLSICIENKREKSGGTYYYNEIINYRYTGDGDNILVLPTLWNIGITMRKTVGFLFLGNNILLRCDLHSWLNKPSIFLWKQLLSFHAREYTALSLTIILIMKQLFSWASLLCCLEPAEISSFFIFFMLPLPRASAPSPITQKVKVIS